jgi:hypothetical protein
MILKKLLELSKVTYFTPDYGGWNVMESKLRAEIKDVICEAMHEEMASFWIERERHYNEHQFIKSWMDWTNKCKSNVLKAIISCLIYAALIGMAFGFIFWGRKQ